MLLDSRWNDLTNTLHFSRVDSATGTNHLTLPLNTAEGHFACARTCSVRDNVKSLFWEWQVRGFFDEENRQDLKGIELPRWDRRSLSNVSTFCSNDRDVLCACTWTRDFFNNRLSMILPDCHHKHQPPVQSFLRWNQRVSLFNGCKLWKHSEPLDPHLSPQFIYQPPRSVC